MADLIAKRYAAALFDIALENKSVDKYYDDVKLVYDSVSDNNDFAEVLKHPQISGEEKLGLLTNTFKGKVSDDILGPFAAAIRKNREVWLVDILKAFMEKADEYRGIVTAQVVSAFPLSEAQLDKIRERLTAKLGKTVIIEHSVDKELIGGVQIRVCGKLIDNTIKKQLSELKEKLYSAQI